MRLDYRVSIHFISSYRYYILTTKIMKDIALQIGMSVHTYKF